MDNTLNSKTRFSSRVTDYVKYRPDYPRRILELLREKTGLAPNWMIADIGCGTGISSRMFLENGNHVVGVEPNADMRRQAELEFVSDRNFHAVNGAAEATTLPAQSADLIVTAQAFHWFDHAACAVEFRRVLRPAPGGWLAILWNTRVKTGRFALEYDELLLQFGSDYGKVAHRTPMPTEKLARTFGVPFQRLTTPNQQIFNFEQLEGRVRSSSYTPLPGQAGHDELYEGLRQLFDQHQTAGTVKFEYETELFLGNLCNRKPQL